MIFKVLDFIFILLVLYMRKSFCHEGGPAWCYLDKSCDPSHWPGLCKTGTKQSPIDLLFAPTDTFQTWKIEFSRDYCRANLGYYIRNNGHSVELTRDKDSMSHSLYMTGEAFQHRRYNFLQMHFHWGSKDGQGSEHVVNGAAYPLELHLVHTKSKYEHVMEAMASGDSDALAVLGIFFVADPTYPDNTALASFIQSFKCVNNTAGDQLFGYRYRTLHLGLLLPQDREAFRYMGSLTTPSCGELVVWTVFRHPVKISVQQMEVFRGMLTHDHNNDKAHPSHLVDNYRPPQALNGRTVQRVRLASDDHSSC